MKLWKKVSFDISAKAPTKGRVSLFFDYLQSLGFEVEGDGNPDFTVKNVAKWQRRAVKKLLKSVEKIEKVI